MTDQEKREKALQALEHCDLCSDMPNCPGCAYLREPDCMEHLKRDIIALLKEQEARVMTLEEVTEDKPDVVWFDDRHYKLTYPAFVSNGEVTGWIVSLSNGCLERHDHIDGYGKNWRCWTSRPIDEQREATPWLT